MSSRILGHVPREVRLPIAARALGKSSGPLSRSDSPYRPA